MDDFPELILEPEYDHMYKNVNICGKPASVLDCGDEAAEWITRFIGENDKDPNDRPDGQTTNSSQNQINYRIVHFDPENQCIRDTAEVMADRLSTINADLPSDINYLTPMTDIAAYTIVTQQSIDYVRSQIENDTKNTKNGPLNEKAFRINLIIDHSDKNSIFEEENSVNILVYRKTGV